MQITAHTIVKNEDIWVWFAICSVLPYVKKILIYDTGSSDKTAEIIKSINSQKIEFSEKGAADPTGFSKLRQEQLDKTTTDWFLILDGDEIWPERQLKKLINFAQTAPENTVAIFNPVRNCIGDIYHFLPENTGNYQIAGKKGNLNIRLIKKTKYLKVVGGYPLEYYSNEKGPIQNQNKDLVFCNGWYLHTSFLQRSTKDEKKTSGSFGRKKIPYQGLKMNSAEFPEVFNLERPKVVPDPFKKRGLLYELTSAVTSPLIDLKRKIR